MATIPLTRRGAEKLKQELAQLKNVERHAVIRAIAEARAQGDLSENAEYDAAKARQEFLKARIGQIQTRIRELSMYTLSSIPHDVVGYGSRVTVMDGEEGTTSEYRIVFPEEVDAASGAISLSSPIGRALLNKTVGDEVEVQAPGGKHNYQIVGLVTLHESAGESSGGGR
jgi:transcription elongation factor GreA